MTLLHIAKGFAVLLVLTPAVAAAQTVRLVEAPLIGRADDTTEAVHKAALATLTEDLHREVEAVAAWPNSEACAACLSGDLGCRADACASDLVDQSGDDVVALVRHPPEDGRAGTIELLWIQQPSYVYAVQQATGEDFHVDQATTAMLEQLALHRRRGPGPWLIVVGSPEGAAVELNGEVIGTLPLEQTVRGGPHAVTVRADGYRSFRQSFDLQQSPMAEAKFDVQLVETQPPRLKRAGWAVAAAGVVLSVLSTAWLASGIRSHRQAETCDGRPGDSLCRQVSPNSTTRAQLGVGAVGLASGLTLGALGLRWALSHQPESTVAHLSVQGAF